ncbi:MAG: AAA family ATPase, partial [bacterium]
SRPANTSIKRKRHPEMARLNKPMYLFLLGIPGCGKSEIYRRLSSRFIDEGLVDDCQRFDDYPILWDYFQEDGPRTEPCEDGGYKILDDSLWDDVLKDLDKKCRAKTDPGILTFIEFARGDNCSALENFSDEILDNSLLIYIYCPFEEAWRRNVERHEEAVEEGTDDHLVSREEMEETYGNDDHEELLENPPVPAVRIDNDEPSLDKLEREVERAFDEIREQLTERV